MGMDSVEIIMGVEEAFEIEIPDEEAAWDGGWGAALL
jgi:acyl carrier protein